MLDTFMVYICNHLVVFKLKINKMTKGDSTCGQRAVYELGLTGIPIVNVNNNCSTGSTALFLAKRAIQGGQSNCVLALGFEKMQRGSLNSQVNRYKC